MKDSTLLMDCEVLVVGGGPAGTVAAIAAARSGAKTVLLERHGFLGGNLTAGGIDTIYGFYTPGDDPQKVVGGVPDEIIARLIALDSCYKRPNTYGSGPGYTFSTEHLKLVLEDMVIDAGVTVLYHSFVPEVFMEGERLTGVLIATKQGLMRISARFIVDATGDADVVAHAGGEYEKAGETGPVQSLTTVFFMANVDIDRAKAFGKKAMWTEMEQANSQGDYALPRVEGSFHATPFAGMIEANMTRIPNVDALDAVALSQAEIEGRHQVQEYVRFLQDKIPGFESAFLVKTGCHIGVRETRRIVGDYILTKEDVVEGRQFEDAVASCGLPIEDHHSGKDTRWVYPKNFGSYDIPYRSLVPCSLSNVLVAGRCLSATHDAHASARASATAMAMGQAAGIAAVMAKGQDARDIEISKLQSKLKAWGAPISA